MSRHGGKSVTQVSGSPWSGGGSESHFFVNFRSLGFPRVGPLGKIFLVEQFVPALVSIRGPLCLKPRALSFVLQRLWWLQYMNYITSCIKVQVLRKQSANKFLFPPWNHKYTHIHKRFEWSIAWALKSSIFVVQKAAAPKNGVEFRQGSIGAIRSSLATPYDVARR